MIKVEMDAAPPPAETKEIIKKYTIKADSVPAIPPVIPLNRRSKNNVNVSGLFSVILFFIKAISRGKITRLQNYKINCNFVTYNFLGLVKKIINNPINPTVIPISAMLKSGMGFKTMKSTTYPWQILFIKLPIAPPMIIPNKIDLINKGLFSEKIFL